MHAVAYNAVRAIMQEAAAALRVRPRIGRRRENRAGSCRAQKVVLVFPPSYRAPTAEVRQEISTYLCLLGIFLPGLLVFFSACPPAAAAQLDQFTYEVVGDEVTSTDYPQYTEGAVEIPAEIAPLLPLSDLLSNTP